MYNYFSINFAGGYWVERPIIIVILNFVKKHNRYIKLLVTFLRRKLRFIMVR